MSSSRNLSLGRRAVVLGALASLTACGYTPVFAPGGQGDGLRGLILTDPPNTRDAFVFVSQFEERLGTADAPSYQLEYLIGTRSDAVGITPSAETTRSNLFGGVAFTLREMGSGRIVTEGFTETFTGYSTTRLTVSTQSVERDAQERLMRILADRVVDQLIATAPDWRG